MSQSYKHWNVAVEVGPKKATAWFPSRHSLFPPVVYESSSNWGCKVYSIGVYRKFRPYYRSEEGKSSFVTEAAPHSSQMEKRNWPRDSLMFHPWWLASFPFIRGTWSNVPWVFITCSQSSPILPFGRRRVRYASSRSDRGKEIHLLKSLTRRARNYCLLLVSKSSLCQKSCRCVNEIELTLVLDSLSL